MNSAEVLAFFALQQGNGDEGSDSCEWETQGLADIQENVLLHHAGRHVAATPHCKRSHDGELFTIKSTPSPFDPGTDHSFIVSCPFTITMKCLAVSDFNIC